MDKKSMIGLGLIAVILIGWMFFNGPSKEDIARNKRIKDSVELANQKAMLELQAKDMRATSIAAVMLPAYSFNAKMPVWFDGCLSSCLLAARLRFPRP